MRVEHLRLLRLLSVIVGAGARVLARRIQFVLDIDRRLEHLSLVLRGDEVTDRGALLPALDVRVVQCWADRVEASACVHVLIDLLGRDGCCSWLQLVHLRLVLLGKVFAARHVQV